MLLWVHPGECICQFDITARNVLDAHVVLLYAEKHTCQPGWGSEEMFGLKRFMVRMHFHVPSIDVLVESLKSKHDEICYVPAAIV